MAPSLLPSFSSTFLFCTAHVGHTYQWLWALAAAPRHQQPRGRPVDPRNCSIFVYIPNVYTLTNTSHGSGWHGLLEDYFPLETGGVHGFCTSMLVSRSVYTVNIYNVCCNIIFIYIYINIQRVMVIIQ